MRLCSPAAGTLCEAGALVDAKNRAMEETSEVRTVFSETKERVEVVILRFRELEC